MRKRKLIKNLPQEHPARALQSVWDKLSLSKHDLFVVMDGSKVLVPKMARQTILKFLHRGHCGFTKTKSLA